MKPPFLAYQMVEWWNTLSVHKKISTKAVEEYYINGCIRELNEKNYEDARTWLEEAYAWQLCWYSWRNFFWNKYDQAVKKSKKKQRSF